METLYEAVTKTAACHNDKCAVIWDDGMNVLTATYREVISYSDVVSECLDALCVETGFVGLFMQQNLSIPTLVLGILRRKLGFVFFDPLRSQEYNSNLIERLNIMWVISQNIGEHEAIANNLLNNAVTKKEFSVHGDFFIVWKLPDVKLCQAHLTDSWNAKGMAYAIQTSGTTGIPKIIRVPHKCILPNIKHLSSTFKLDETDVVFFGTPLTFDPSIVELFLALTCGASLLILPSVVRASPSKLLDILFPVNDCSHPGVTLIQTTPSLVSCWSLQNLQERVLGSSTTLKYLLLGGEPCPTLDILREWRGPGNTTRMFSLYGITEVSCWAAVCDIDKLETKYADCLETEKNSSNSNRREYSYQDIPLGAPLMDTILEVRNDSGFKIDRGEGEVYIGSSNRICVIDKEIEENVTLPVFRATGDIVKICGDNANLYFMGRKDNMIKRYGERVSLCEIEKKVDSFSGVEKCCCSWEQPKGILGIAVILKQSCDHREPLGMLKQNMTEHLPKAAFPDYISVVDVLPLTSHGKIDRSKLREIIFGNAFTKLITSSPTIGLHEVLQSVWLQLLGINPKPEDTFLQHGGHSVLALLFSSEIERALGKTMPSDFIPLLLTGSTFKECYDCLKGGIATDYPSSDSDLNNTATETELPATVFQTSGNSDYCSSERSSKRKLSEENGMGCMTCKSCRIEHCRDRNFEIFQFSGNKGELVQKSLFSQELKVMKRGSDGLELTKIVKVAMNPVSTEEDLRKDKDSRLIGVRCRGQIIYGPESVLTVCNKHEELKLELGWRYNMGKCVDASPCYLQFPDDRTQVVMGSHSHRLTVLDGILGTVVAECLLPDRIESSVCILPCGNYGIVGCYDGFIYCIDLNTGSIQWSYKTDGMVKSSPALCLNRSAVVVGSYDHFLYCISVQKGSLIWCTKPGDGSIFASPCVSKNATIYIATLDGTCAALCENTGTMQWFRKLDSPVFSSPALLETSAAVLFAEVKGIIHCFLSTTGTKLWTYQAGGNIFSSLSIQAHKSQEFIAIGCHDKNVYCLRHEEGNTISCHWKLQMDSAVFATPFMFQVLPSRIASQLDGALYAAIATTKGTILLIDIQLGFIKSSYLLPHEVFSSPVICSKNLVVGCRDNYVYSLNLVT